MDHTQKVIIKQVAIQVEKELSGEGTGHDWYHTFRVWRMAIKIAQKEKADLFIVELAALLHDIADWKLYGGDASVGSKRVREILSGIKVPPGIIKKVCEIIEKASYKGSGVKDEISTIEGKIVQDADRLDAMGAIGIARVFAYGGMIKRPLYDPNIQVFKHKTKEEYIKTAHQSTSVNHFYEKVLLLKARMNTKAAQKIAQKRHRFIEDYLKRFYQEWDGKD